MSATDSFVWEKPGAWSFDSEQHELDLPSSSAAAFSFSDDLPPFFTPLKTDFSGVVKGNPFGVKMQDLNLKDFPYLPVAEEIAVSESSLKPKGFEFDKGYHKYDSDDWYKHEMELAGNFNFEVPEKDKGVTLRIQRALAAKWPFVSANINLESCSEADAAYAARVAAAAAQVAAADAANAAQIMSSAAAFAATATATAAAHSRKEEVKPKTKAPLDNPTRRTDELKPKTKAPLNNPTRRHGRINHELEDKLRAEKARKALEYYKDTKGEEFEFVQIENYEAAILPPYMLYHITFMAKRKYISDSCPELFFAELYERWEHDGKFLVKMCMILDPSGQDVKNGCGIKGSNQMLHPKGVEFFAGPPGGTPECLGSSSSGAR